jgi:type VI secretion system protein ImpC
MSESAGEAVLRLGLMPLLSYRSRNMVRVLRFQSIADPAQPLLGVWLGAAGG